MTKFEQFLENRAKGGIKEAEEVNNLMSDYLSEKEIVITRMIHGIGYHSKSIKEICDILGFEENEVMHIYQHAMAILNACLEARERRLIDCKGVTDDDVRKLKLHKEITIKEYIDNIENEMVQEHKIGKRQMELYHIAKENLPLYYILSPLDLNILDKIPLNEIKHDILDPDFDQKYTKLYKTTPTLASLLKYKFNFKLGKVNKNEIAILQWRHFVLNNAQDIIARWQNKEDTIQNPHNTIFPSHFDKEEPLGTSYMNMVSEMISFFESTSSNPKNKLRAQVLNFFFNEHLSLKEIVDKTNVSITTIKDNFIDLLFKDGKVNEISLNPLFKKSIESYIKTIFYSPMRKILDEVQLDEDNLLCLLSLYGAEVFECKQFHQDAIIIHKGDIIRAKECIQKLFNILGASVFPISKQQLMSQLTVVVDSDKWLPEYVESIISTNDLIHKTDNNLLYVSDNLLKDSTLRICRIIDKFPNHIATKEEIRTEYIKLYGKEPSNFQIKEMEENNFFSISEGVYMYSPCHKPITVHEFMNEYISTNILFRWSEFIEKIKTINPKVKARSERTYTTKRCSVCSSDSDLLVLKGHENDYPQYKWGANRKSNVTNFFLKKAVEILKEQKDYQMPYNLFIRQLNTIVVNIGYSGNNTGSVIKNYSNKEPKLFEILDGNIRLNMDVLEDTPMEYLGKGYKYAESYLSIYALAVSELKTKPGHKMLRSDFAKLAKSQISDDIDVRIVNKAFEDRLKPSMLYVHGKRANAFICLDIKIFKEETRDEQQYKIENNDTANTNETAPVLVVDTTPRHTTTYRKVFNWPDIISMLKRELVYYDKPYFFQGITSDSVLEKFKKFMSQSNNAYLNELIPQAYYELNYAHVDKWSSYDYRSKIALAFESLLAEIYFQNQGVELHAKGLMEIMDRAFPDYKKARINSDKSGFNGILNKIYNDRNRFAHAVYKELPPITSNLTSFVSYMALYVYTVAKYYNG